MVGTVILMCGPAGAGKTTHARALEAAGATRLSYDEEFWRRGFRGTHPAPKELAEEVKVDLDARLEELVAQGGDVVLDYSFSTRAMRDEYRALAAGLGAPTRLVFVTAPLEVLLGRVARRAGAHPDDARLDPEVLRSWVDGFEAPTPDEDPEVVSTDGSA
ncbi:putative ATP/GTP-binding protein [Serinicoccus hydrothermalis]|uniref:Putative ATP/GTP-binding protein n=1 Tax=Serinicoccus hydrothermalis TaxID=1758689 RepID=A0A1B1NF37_9MICO|nr:ATP-binding protein [Serinicoccus hydrothermalis]ANS80009.1 putative ATP/GTP-binding protein [Serinicoccus hydrothermalis]